MTDIPVFALAPTLFLTITGNSASEKVLEKLKEIAGEKNILCIVCSNKDAVRAIVETHTPQRTVALFDNNNIPGRKHFKMMVSEHEPHEKLFASWAHDEKILWGVEITPKKCNTAHCARMLYGIFIKHFIYDPLHGKFPWGNKRRKKEHTGKHKRKTKRFLEHFTSC